VCVYREVLCIYNYARAHTHAHAPHVSVNTPLVCVRATIIGDRALTINTLFNMRRLRGNNYEKKLRIHVCVCMCVWRSYIQTHETNKIALTQIRARADGNFQTLVNPPVCAISRSKNARSFFPSFFSIFANVTECARSMIIRDGLSSSTKRDGRRFGDSSFNVRCTRGLSRCLLKC